MTDTEEQFLTDQLDKLRDQYVTATLRQRAGKAVERLRHPSAYPNLLVSRIAGIEALARSLMMHTEATTKNDLRNIYKKYRYRKTHTLVADYCRYRSKEPADYFGPREWRLFKLAVQYRNLLIHECTFLGHQKFTPLEDACATVFQKLVSLARIKLKAT